ncbi:MAG: CoxG family protein [Caldimonas sp.]
MKIEKQFTVSATQERIWAFITDPNLAGPCIPGCKDVEVLGPGRYRATVQIQVGPIKASFSVTVEARVERPPEYAEYTVQGDEGGKASRITAVNVLSITRLTDTECEVKYSSEVNVVGRLGKFGSGVMQKIADNVGEQFAQSLRAGLSEDRGAEFKEGAVPAAGSELPARMSARPLSIFQDRLKSGLHALLAAIKALLKRSDAARPSSHERDSG